MPTFGEAFDWKAWSRASAEITAQLKAKGLVEGTGKFSEVLRRKLKKRFPGGCGY